MCLNFETLKKYLLNVTSCLFYFFLSLFLSPCLLIFLFFVSVFFISVFLSFCFISFLLIYICLPFCCLCLFFSSLSLFQSCLFILLFSVCICFSRFSHACLSEMTWATPTIFNSPQQCFDQQRILANQVNEILNLIRPFPAPKI
jgi:hypothetical protein